MTKNWVYSPLVDRIRGWASGQHTRFVMKVASAMRFYQTTIEYHVVQDSLLYHAAHLFREHDVAGNHLLVVCPAPMENRRVLDHTISRHEAFLWFYLRSWPLGDSALAPQDIPHSQKLGKEEPVLSLTTTQTGIPI